MTAILPVAYLPPISHFIAMLGNTDVKWDIYENYHKQFYYNRCIVYGPNGAQKLTVPVHKKYERTAIKDITIANEVPWQKIHWKSLEAAYRRSPYFEYYEGEISPLYLEYQPESLLEWNMKIFEAVCALLEIEMKPAFTSEYHKQYVDANDFRNLAIPENAVDIKEVKYQQVFEEKYGFIPNLSIIDLLFCEGPHAKKLLLN